MNITIANTSRNKAIIMITEGTTTKTGSGANKVSLHGSDEQVGVVAKDDPFNVEVE